MIGVVCSVLIGCASAAAPPKSRVLLPPATAKPETAKALTEGNRLFDAREFDQAKAQYEAAIKLDPSLAEAHYNLGMVFYLQNQDTLARKHFVEAADLAPGDKVIWNAPVFREAGEVESNRTKTGGLMVAPAFSTK
jgi:Tfp pilus assembly protein PilF